MVGAIAEGDVDDAVGADLLDGGDATGFEEFSQPRHERRGRGSRCSRVLGDMASETGVDDELFAMVGFGELE